MNYRVLLSAIFGLSLLAADASAHVPKAAKSREVCGTGGAGLNFRSAPSLHARVRTVLPEDQDIKLLGISSNGKWLRVRNQGNGQTGWVYRSFTCRKSAGGGRGNGGGGAAVGGSIAWWRNPVMGTCVTSDFGPRPRPCSGCSSYHRGCDLGAGCGTRVRAAAGGTVIISSYDPGGFGNYIAVRHGNGVVSYYAHLSSRNVRPGQRVGADTILGRVGSTGASTGCHLHFETRRNGVAFDPQSLIGQGRCPRVGRSTGGRTLNR